MIAGLGFGELLLVFGIVLLFFGAKRLPEFAGALGSSIRTFRRGMNEVTGELAGASPEVPPAAPSQLPERTGGSEP